MNISSENNFEFGFSKKQIPNDVSYFRDIPCQKDIYRAYYIGYKFGIVKNKTDI